MSHFVINLWIELLLRRVSEGGGDVLLDDLVVGADGDRGEVNVPDGVVGAGDRGYSGVVLPLGVDRPYHASAQDETSDCEHQPYYPEDSTRFISTFY